MNPETGAAGPPERTAGTPGRFARSAAVVFIFFKANTMPLTRPPALVSLIDTCLYALAAGLVVVLLSTVTAGVVYRAMNAPLSWTDEISGFLMVWLACAGWMIATRQGSHIRIRLLIDKMPDSAWRSVEIISQTAVAAIGLVAAWQSIHLMRVNHDIEAISLPVSMAWLYAPILPAGLMTALQAIADMCAPRPTPSPTEDAPWSA